MVINRVFRVTFVPIFLFTSLEYSSTDFLLFVGREKFFPVGLVMIHCCLLQGCVHTMAKQTQFHLNEI